MGAPREGAQLLQEGQAPLAEEVTAEGDACNRILDVVLHPASRKSCG